MVDLNAKIGEGPQDDIIGKQGFGMTEENARYFLLRKRTRTITFPNFPKRLLYTWK